MEEVFASLTLRERVGQMINVWILGDYSNFEDPSFARVLELIRANHVGAVTMSLGSPIEVADKINVMQRACRIPLLVAADLEPNLGRLDGGVFDHYLIHAGGATVFPSAMAIAATGRISDAYEVAKAIADEARAVGISVNYAPVADLNSNPSNPVISTRSFGEEPSRVAELAAAFVRGTQDAGVVATIKHFPGHGDTTADSHSCLPITGASIARLEAIELVPFAKCINAGAAIVMTAHVALPAVTGNSMVPATLSKPIMTDLLRDRLGFSGLAISDALSMPAVTKSYSLTDSCVLAVKSGIDMLLDPTDPHGAIDAIVSAVEQEMIPSARIDAAVRRILELKARTGVAAHRFVSLDTVRRVVGSPGHRSLAMDIARRSVTLLRDHDCLVCGPSSARTLLVNYLPDTELRAGNVMFARMLAGLGSGNLRLEKIGPTATQARLDLISRAAANVERFIIAMYVRRVEGSGRTAIPPHIAAWIDQLSISSRIAVIAFGNPYLIGQFPQVRTYMVTYGIGDALEHAAAEVLLGEAPVGGRVPISFPGYFKRGDGLTRS